MHFTLGIEEELQIVDPRTGRLCPRILTIMEKGAATFGERIKPEMLQSAVEIISPQAIIMSISRAAGGSVGSIFFSSWTSVSVAYGAPILPMAETTTTGA